MDGADSGLRRRRGAGGLQKTATHASAALTGVSGGKNSGAHRVAAWLGALLVVATPVIAVLSRMPDVWMFHPVVYAAGDAIGLPAAWTPTAAGVLLGASILVLAGSVRRSPVRSTLLLFGLYGLTMYHADHRLATPTFACQTAGISRPCTVLVTGGNQGIGFAVASALRRQGHRVVVGCRSPARCAAAVDSLEHQPRGENGGATGAADISPAAVGIGGLDLGVYATVAAFVDDVKRLLGPSGGKVDILVNNAGLTPDGNWTTAEGYEPGFGIMHLGHFALTEWLWQAGLLAEDALVVQVSSAAMRLGAWARSLHDHPEGEGDLRGELTVGCTSEGAPLCFPAPTTADGPDSAITGDWYTRRLRWGAYPRAKLANVLYARELPRRYKGLRAVSVHPGMVQTTLAVAPARHFVPSWAAWIGEAQDAYMRVLLRTPDSSATVVLAAAHAALQQPPLGPERRVHANGLGQLLEDRHLPPAAADHATASRLWAVSHLHLQAWEARRALGDSRAP